MAEEMRIRPIRLSDAEDLSELLRAPGTFETTLILPDDRIASREEFIRNLTGDDHVLAAEEGKGSEARVVGYAGLHVVPRARRRHVGQVGIAVRPDRQGRGIGRALMGALLDLADNWLMLERVELFVFADNQEAVRFYHSLGFEVEGTLRRSSVKAGVLADDLLMARLRPEPS
jgi:putative acetyltransferase